MKKLKKEKNNKSRLIKIGSFLLIVLCSLMIVNEKYKEHKIQEVNEDLLIEFFEEQETLITEEKVKEEPVIEEKKEIQVNQEKYLGVLEIKKINLTRGFYKKESINNNENKNIKLLKESDMPDKVNGNIILAGHSGNSYVSFFRKLPDLVEGDEAIIHYEGKSYIYSLLKRYEIEKTGTANIVRNGKNSTLTLITCKHNTNKQLVFIFDLKNIE